MAICILKRASLGFSILPLSFLCLNMSTVSKHNTTQISCSLCGNYLAAKTIGIKKWKQSGMIDMSMCKKNIIDLILIWEEYKGQNFVLVGVDVWDKPERHKQALQQLGITYPQVIDDTKNSTELYGVEGIPHIMLISSKGIILARDLRGAAIEEAVRKALGL